MVQRHHSTQYDVPWLAVLADLNARGKFGKALIDSPVPLVDSKEEAELLLDLDAVAILLRFNGDPDPLAPMLRKHRKVVAKKLWALHTCPDPF